MGEDRLRSAASQLEGLRREAMLEPEAVSAMLRLKELGFGTVGLREHWGQSQHD
jgi:hypothetical protein